MPSTLKRLIVAAVMSAGILQPVTAFTETAVLPVFIGYPHLRFLAQRHLFKGPDRTLRYALDEAGCTAVTLAEPTLAADGDHLRLDVATVATFGVDTAEGCNAVGSWTGRTTVKGKPAWVAGQRLAVVFDEVTAEISDRNGQRLADAPLFESFEERLRQEVASVDLDLSPGAERLKEWLPSVLPRYPAGRLHEIIDRLRIADIDVEPDGLSIRLAIDIEEAFQASSEPALSAAETARLEGRIRSWDAFLSFVVKQAAIATPSADHRAALLEVLLDARYEMAVALTADPLDGEDPVRRLFVRSWERLAPVMREISIQSPQQNPDFFIGFMTAADALAALDRLGPAVGLELSTDGLRRLARFLNDNPAGDPLEYLEGIDPLLQSLFGIGLPEENDPRKKQQGFHWQLVPSAFAAPPRHRLDRWVPTTSALAPYLRDVRRLLLGEAEARLQVATVTGEHYDVFRKLMLAAAWQESCWRQYVVKRNKIVPLVSASGDVGLLQINERIWRGFYARDKLRWDIAYNARAGSQILFRFFTAYALKRQEHRRVGGASNLARAAYSAYNGGPSKVGRYRSKGVPGAQKKIDAAFWSKYQRVDRGEVLAVAECLGGSAMVSQTDAAPTGRGKTGSKQTKPPATAERVQVENSHWIEKQHPGHFTVQLAALSSERAVKKLVEKYALPGTFAWCRIKNRNRAVYIAVYGSFATSAEAQKAAARFAALRPWTRTFGGIQKAMAK
jgi:hypothetical protein